MPALNFIINFKKVLIDNQAKTNTEHKRNESAPLKLDSTQKTTIPVASIVKSALNVHSHSQVIKRHSSSSETTKKHTRTKAKSGEHELTQLFNSTSNTINTSETLVGGNDDALLASTQQSPYFPSIRVNGRRCTGSTFAHAGEVRQAGDIGDENCLLGAGANRVNSAATAESSLHSSTFGSTPNNQSLLIKDIFQLNSMLISRPYQLTRLASVQPTTEATTSSDKDHEYLKHFNYHHHRNDTSNNTSLLDTSNNRHLPFEVNTINNGASSSSSSSEAQKKRAHLRAHHPSSLIKHRVNSLSRLNMDASDAERQLVHMLITSVKQTEKRSMINE